MKYENIVLIKGDLSEVTALYQDEKQLANWQEGFLSVHLIAGEKGKVGAKSEFQYMNKRRPMEIMETIISNDLPREKKALYEHIHMTNTLKSSLRDLGNGEIELKTEVDYIKFDHWMPKILAKFFPNMFKKQSQKWLDQFKILAESRA